jgi:hypothetical protein
VPSNREQLLMVFVPSAIAVTVLSYLFPDVLLLSYVLVVSLLIVGAVGVLLLANLLTHATRGEVRPCGVRVCSARFAKLGMYYSRAQRLNDPSD